MDLTGRIGLLTGTTSGIGRATAIRSAAGARADGSRDEQRGRDVATPSPRRRQDWLPDRLSDRRGVNGRARRPRGRSSSRPSSVPAASG